MTDLGRLLRKKRLKDGGSLRGISEDNPFSQQVLSNYERGLSLPQPKMLPALAACYGIALKEVVSAHQSSVPQALAGSISQEPFLNAIESVSVGDHVVVITQRSILDDRQDMAGYLARIIDQGAFFTYVAFIPESDAEDDSYRWENNHRYCARIIIQAMRKAGVSDAASRRFLYLVIGNPSLSDFAFLRAHGATVYLCRGEETEYLESQAWSEMKAPDGQPWWTPYHESFTNDLHDWLVYDCCLPLPGCEDVDVGIDAGVRGVSIERLEEFLREQQRRGGNR
jgi:transcriptional regulator with XRE-family HTH domain